MTSHRHPRYSKFRGRSRRGVLLLFVLAILAMFGLIGFAFVMMTSHARRGAQAFARMDQNDARPDELAHRAFLVAARGSNDRASAIGPHSLLEDMNGNSTVHGTIAPALGNVDTVPPGGADSQLVNIRVSGIAATDVFRYVGRVLTMEDGPAAGVSFRIVDHSTSTVPPTLQLLNDNGKLVVGDVNAYFTATGKTIHFIINGAPFSGTGFGFNAGVIPPTGPVLTEMETIYTDDTGTPVSGYTALLPNASAHRKTDPLANEDYDAVDFQNMLLALQLPVGENDGISVPIPSLHRPALVRYWMDRLAQDPVNFQNLNAVSGWNRALLFLHPDKIPDAFERERVIDLKRKILLRPLVEDHPNFNGGNATVDTTASVLEGYNPLWDGQFSDTLLNDGICDFRWDVDNDGDAVQDSIWVDLGLPIQQTEDGRLVKPLVAILCVDMDGRLNVNAHGCIAQLNTGATNYYGHAGTEALPRGHGYGPADVNLLPLFMERYPIPAATGDPDLLDLPSLQALVLPYYQNLLVGSAPISTLGRYGDVPGMAAPGDPALDDYASQNHWFNYWTFYFTAPQTPSPNLTAYGTPPDIIPDGVIYLDTQSAPFRMEIGQGGERLNDPYELNLNLTNATDSPFLPTELEALLRPFDMDSDFLSSRLLDLTDNILLDNRNEITTESWDLPCPNVAVPQMILGKKCRSLAELLFAKGCPSDQLAGILSPEVRVGLRMNLNCPFGNGRDDDGDLIVDEPGEPETANAVFLDPTTPAPLLLDHDNDGLLGSTVPSRQLVARYLYVLLYVLTEPWTDPEWADEYHGGALANPRAHTLAQWAVNIVDFMDRDSIITGFEYDPNPLNGWDPAITGDFSTGRVVWGCERPELVISETLAIHDRRTQDTSEDASSEKIADGDTDFDSKIRPEASLFFELLNPWTATEALPREVYVERGGYVGVDLRKKDTRTGNSPVWRVAIVEGDPDGDPATMDDDLDNPGLAAAPRILRSVYFTQPAGGQNYDTSDGFAYYPRPGREPQLALLLPGRYAVVGPAKTDDYNNSGGGSSTTFFGFKGEPDPTTAATYNDNTVRRIEFHPSNDPDAADQVKVFSQGAIASVNDLDSLTIREPIAVPINCEDLASGRSVRLSITEPTAGYEAYPAGGQQYNPVKDVPIDQTVATGLAGAEKTLLEFAVQNNGTLVRARTLHLQRLANPLEPFDSITNPYITIDSMPVDLTAFNGMPGTDPMVMAGTTLFYTRERGEDEESLPERMSTPQEVHKHYNWWTQGTNVDPTINGMGPIGTSPMAGGGNFSEEFDHTLGYLNEGYGPPCDGTAPSYTAAQIGYPKFRVPWLKWNNRPYISQYELLNVPAYRPSRLLAKVKVVKPLPDPTVRPPTPDELEENRRPYGEPSKTGPDVLLHDPFGHTLNFFYCLATHDRAAKELELHRFLDFVHVPSRFTGTDTMLDQSALAGVGHSLHPPYNWFSKFREPGRMNLNTIFSENVWRGLMNNYPHGNPDPVYGRSWQWNRFQRSRQGYDDPLLNPALNIAAKDPQLIQEWKRVLPETSENILAKPLTIDPKYPTRFAKPFRSSFGASLVPPIHDTPADPSHTSLMPLREVESTVLRSDAPRVYQPDNSVTPNLANHHERDISNNPLFSFDERANGFYYNPSYVGPPAYDFYFDPDKAPSPTIMAQINAIWAEDTTAKTVEPRLGKRNYVTDYNDTMRNPYFRYQGLQRLGNLTTTRSNVYAIWLTIGYFEVEPRPNRTHAGGAAWTQAEYDAVYPDGYAIGQELGSDTGDIKRHRAFYLFDRSIPVGFERGKDHNVEDAILIRRFIE